MVVFRFTWAPALSRAATTSAVLHSAAIWSAVFWYLVGTLTSAPASRSTFKQAK